MPTPGTPTKPVEGAVIATAWGGAIHDAVFGQGTTFAVLEGWYEIAIPQGLADHTLMKRYGQAISQVQAPLVGWSAYIYGFFWRVNAVPTAGKVTLGEYHAGFYNDTDKVEFGPGLPGAINGVKMLTDPAPLLTTHAVCPWWSTSADVAGMARISVGLMLAYDYRGGLTSLEAEQQ